MRVCTLVLVLIVLVPIILEAPLVSASQGQTVRVIIGIKSGFNYDKAVKVLARLGQSELELQEIGAVVLSLPQVVVLHVLKLPFVKYVEEDKLVRAVGEVQWNIEMVNATGVWEEYYPNYSYAAYGAGTQVAVLDTGVDYTHEDLRGSVVYCIVSLRNSKTYYEGANLKNCADPNGHGTHVAGIIVAKLNGIGVVGVAPGATLYAVKVLGASGSGYVSDVAKGVVEAVKGPDDIVGTDDDADIISMSLGGPDSQALRDAVVYAYNSGAILVAAAGNEGAPSPSYPAAYDQVIAVGAINSNYTVATWSNRRPDVVAPGVNIMSTWPKNKYANASGTSMACPHVSGAVALAQALRVATGKSKLAPEAMIGLVRETALDLGVQGPDEYYGYGLVDAHNLVQRALET